MKKKKVYVGINQFADRYAIKMGITKTEAGDIVRSVFDCEQETLLDPSVDGIQIVGFRTIEKVDRKGKIGRNPRKPEEEIQIPPYKTIKTKIGKPFKAKLNNK